MKIISVDFQKDFTAPGGIKFHPARTAPYFIKHTLIPFFKKHKIKIAEIISDDRLPRPGEFQSYCVPGTEGYQSEIPSSIRYENVWLKALYSPDWIRVNLGLPNKKPGKIYQESAEFTNWLNNTIGLPSETAITLIGLTLDCCVLCTAQQLYFRGYKVYFLEEGVDLSDPTQLDKHKILRNNIFIKWANPINWQNLSKILVKKNV